MNAAIDLEQLKRRAVAFARNTSTEISPHDEGKLESLVGVLPAGMTIYVAHTPKAQMFDVMRVAAKVQSLGFRASPQLGAFLRYVVEEVLGGRGASLKGYTLAVEALGREAKGWARVMRAPFEVQGAYVRGL